VSDLNTLWPQKPPGIRLIVAAYGSNPGYPGKFAHQFTDHANTPPFGPSDLNSADGMSAHDLQLMFGMTSAPKPTATAETAAPAQQMPGTRAGPKKAGTGFRWEADGTKSLQEVAAYRHAAVVSLLEISAANLNEENHAELNKYVLSGVSYAMPEGLVFYTAFE
jgi:hypothetical protein